MDRKFNADEQWFTSPLITMRDFLEEAWTAELQLRQSLNRPGADYIPKEEDFHETQLLNDFMDLTSCSSSTAANIFKDIDMSNLLPDEQKGVKREYKNVLENYFGDERLNPELLRVHQNVLHNAELMNNPQKKSNFLRTMKYDRFDKCDIGLKREMPEWHMTTEKDIVILVSVLPSYNKILSTNETRASRLMAPKSKFMLRGETTLHSLRKKLTCVTDMVLPLESGKELEPQDIRFSHLYQYPSSFIFIHDTFYVDYSPPNATDISKPIREFMARKKCFDPVYHKDMEGVRIIDLKLRLGMPYLFQHSGTCEHMLVFHDLRLLHKSDFQSLDRYPLQAYDSRGDIKCAACKTNFATFRVDECDRLPSASMLFCESCFREFHFHHQAKIGRFRAHPFYQSNRLNFV